MDKPLKNNVAFIVKQISEIRGDCPGKKVLQKFVYLIEQKGIDLGFEYGLHFYGPYCSELDAETINLNSNGVIKFDYSGYSHKMSVNEGLTVSSTLSNDDANLVCDIIKKFKDMNPSALELLSTTIYAYRHLEDRSNQNIINGVKKIKGDKYTDNEIEGALKNLNYFKN